MQSKLSGMRKKMLPLLAALGMTACAISPSAPKYSAPCYCPVAIHLDDASRAWLAKQKPPESVNQYVHKIGEQQKSIIQNCGD